METTFKNAVENINNAGKKIKSSVVLLSISIIISIVGSLIIYYIVSQPGQALASFGYSEYAPESLAAFSQEDLTNYNSLLVFIIATTSIASIIFFSCSLITLYTAGTSLSSIRSLPIIEETFEP